MTSDEMTALFQQHATIMTEIQNVYIALAVAAFVGLVFIGLMFGAAAWSVRSVNNTQRELANTQRELEGKFALLIDVLLEQAHREIAARSAEVTGENVVVEGQHG